MSHILHSSIVRIQTVNRLPIGVGFLVTERHILTCAHVVRDALSQPPQGIPTELVCLDFPLLADSQPLTARVIIWQPDRDIACLELTSPPPDGASSIRLLAANNIWGHACRAFGFPATHDDGVWALAILRDRKANGQIQLEATTATAGYAIEAGFSGTPVWDEVLNGVVGMIVTASGNKERRANTKAAFMIPTSKLMEALPESLGGQLLVESDTEAEYRAYLQKENHHLKMNGIPIGAPADIPLTKLYIKLQVLPEKWNQQDSDSDSDSTLPKKMSEIMRYLSETQWQRPERSDDTSKKAVDPLNVVEEHRGVMIWGQPGAGKSTLLRYLTHYYAANPDSPLPLFVPLKKLPAFLQKTPAFMDAILDLLTEHTTGQKRQKLKATLTTAIEARKVRFLFDGLDEVQNRAIDQNLSSLASDGHYIVVTSRPFDQIRISGYQHVEVLPLSLEDAKEFVQNWFDILADVRSIAKHQRRMWSKEQTEQLNKQLKKQPALQKVARNPLMLTFLAVLAGDNPRQALPRSRADLYQRYVETLFTSWESFRHQQKQLIIGEMKGGKAKKLSLWALYQVAWLLHQAHYAEKTSQFPARKQIESHLSQQLTKRGMSWLEAESLPTEILNFWIEAGLLDQHHVRGKEWLLFRHQMFQEYGAVRALEALPEDEHWSILASHLHKPQWQEVVLLTAANLPDASDFISRILKAGQRHPLEPHLHKHLFLAARCLSEGANVSSKLLAQVVNELEKLLLSNISQLWNAATELLLGIGQANGHDLVLPVAKCHISSSNLEARESAIYLLTELSVPNIHDFCFNYIEEVITNKHMVPRSKFQILLSIVQWLSTQKTRRNEIITSLVRLKEYKHISFTTSKEVENTLIALEAQPWSSEIREQRRSQLQKWLKSVKVNDGNGREIRFMQTISELLSEEKIQISHKDKLVELEHFLSFLNIPEWLNKDFLKVAYTGVNPHARTLFLIAVRLAGLDKNIVAAQAKWLANELLMDKTNPYSISKAVKAHKSNQYLLPSFRCSDTEIDTLIQALGHNLGWIRRLAANLLQECFDERILDALNKALTNNTNVAIRIWAVYFLGSLTKLDKQTVQSPITTLHNDESWQVRREAVEPLTEYFYQEFKITNSKKDEVIQTLIKGYDSYPSSEELCSECGAILIVTQSSCSECNVGTSTLQEAIIEALGEIAEPITAVMEIMTHALRDSNEEIRDSAGKAILKLWPKEPTVVSEFLIATVQEFTMASKELSGVAQAIARIPHQPQAKVIANRDMSLLGEWLSLAKHPSQSIRRAAIVYLSTVYRDDALVVSALVECLDDEEESVREEAFKALNQQSMSCKMGHMARKDR